MKNLIHVFLAGMILSGSILYANSTTYNYKIPSIEDEDSDAIKKFVNEFSVMDLVEEEILKVQQQKASAKLELHRKIEKEKQNERNKVKKVSRGWIDRGTFTITAYDLSVASCGKNESHYAYGITANGTSLKGETLESARAIAVDPKVIKLGTKVQLEFVDEEYQHLNSIYTAVDTGGAIKGKIIDIFFGSGNVKQQVKNFGRRSVKVTILPNN